MASNCCLQKKLCGDEKFDWEVNNCLYVCWHFNATSIARWPQMSDLQGRSQSFFLLQYFWLSSLSYPWRWFVIGAPHTSRKIIFVPLLEKRLKIELSIKPIVCYPQLLCRISFTSTFLDFVRFVLNRLAFSPLLFCHKCLKLKVVQRY